MRFRISKASDWNFEEFREFNSLEELRELAIEFGENSYNHSIFINFTTMVIIIDDR